MVLEVEVLGRLLVLLGRVLRGGVWISGGRLLLGGGEKRSIV